ncbi:unnamed protein product [Rotaria magnacalcarata]|uniref:Uncharacterized protein n=2 Tax=Rotaria magnacalcarata TaxID=392030 RepID=A0A816PZJ3_9BILA|nr:unnamed protein product [Rotaria magnacalcarata]CAF4006477.1 unnamed protein product [Rotaria magnacalcarata]
MEHSTRRIFHSTLRGELYGTPRFRFRCKNRKPLGFGMVPFFFSVAFTIEFGNPDIREEFKWVKLISPLYNIPTNPKTYPAILVTTTDHDDGEITNRRGRPLIVRIDVRVGYSVDKPTPIACRGLRSGDGRLYVHGVVVNTKEEIHEAWSEEVRQRIETMMREIHHEENNYKCVIEHIERVKPYGLHLDHLVVDLLLTEISPLS